MRTITLRIRGSAGNQFFQYAFARNVQERLGGRLVINYASVHNTDGQWPGSDNLLKDFNVVSYAYSLEKRKIDFFLLRLIKLYCKVFHYDFFKKKTYRLYLWCARHLEKTGLYFFDAAYYPYKYPKVKGNIVIEGYFESPRYFAQIDEKICQELTPKHPLLEQNRELYDIITKRNSVCITIKRQDVENPDISEIYEYDLNYFYHAVNYIRQQEKDPVFIIFSDNIQWCRANFLLDGEVYYEKPDNPIWEKVRLMSGCKHFIIHNSTFSWWVQHLSRRQGKIVIAPVKWMLRDDQPIDIYEDNWIYMRNDGTIQETHD